MVCLLITSMIRCNQIIDSRNQKIRVGKICVQQKEVSISDFKEFKSKTKYISDFDITRRGFVYSFDKQQWKDTLFGVDWTTYQRNFDHNLPATMVSYRDACAYCDWLGGRLPTNAEWDKYIAKEITQGNTWQGIFPYNDSGEDGYKNKMNPVGHTPPNMDLLYDVQGNVWEWVAKEGFTTMVRGASYLSDLKICGEKDTSPLLRLPEYRTHMDVGFRCVYDNC